ALTGPGPTTGGPGGVRAPGPVSGAPSARARPGLGWGCSVLAGGRGLELDRGFDGRLGGHLGLDLHGTLRPAWSLPVRDVRFRAVLGGRVGRGRGEEEHPGQRVGELEEASADAQDARRRQQIVPLLERAVGPALYLA